MHKFFEVLQKINTVPQMDYHMKYKMEHPENMHKQQHSIELIGSVFAFKSSQQMTNVKSHKTFFHLRESRRTETGRKFNVEANQLDETEELRILIWIVKVDGEIQCYQEEYSF